MPSTQNHAAVGKGPRVRLLPMLGLGFSALVAIALTVPGLGLGRRARG